MIKKQFSFYVSAILMLFLASCSTEELNNEVTPENLNRLNRSAAAKSAGDGIYDVLGHGYNVTEEYANTTSAGFQVVDVDRLKAEQPARVVVENTFTQEYLEEYGENAQTYSSKISTKVDATAGIPVFKGLLSVGFNTSISNGKMFDSKYIYGSYNLTIKHKRFRINSPIEILRDYATPEFVQYVQMKTPKEVVENYGTHVMLDIYTGAKMDILFQSETSNESREYAARVGIKAGMLKVFDLNISNDIDVSSSEKNFSRKLYYRTRGGNPSKNLIGQVNLDQSNPKIDIAGWQSTSTPNNSELVDFGKYGLVPIYELVKDPIKKAQLKTYVDQYLIDNKVYLDYKTVPIYRYYNAYGDHYYSQASSAPSGYHSEGIEFNAFAFKAPNSVPIYQFYNTKSGDHYYTQSSTTPAGYQYEGIAFYAHSTMVANSVPIYMYYNNRGDHFYTKSSSTPGGYRAEGIWFYAY